MLEFYCSTNKIIRIVFIVTVSLIHCWLCSSINHNSTRCHLHTAPCKVYTASHNPGDLCICAALKQSDWCGRLVGSAVCGLCGLFIYSI